MVPERVLVVEDERIIAKDIKCTLEALGYSVPAIANSGEEALEKVASTHPDVVLMDIVLKGPMDGVEAAEQIRARFDLPVVYLTAHADAQTLQRAKITEPFGYVLKPFDESDLRTTLEMATYKHAMERKLRASERWFATTLRSVGDAVIATDAQGRVQFMNPIAEALTGWKQEEAVGVDSRRVFALVEEETRKTIGSPILNALQSGLPVELNNRALIISKRGAEIPVDDSAALIKHDDGTIEGAVLVFRDITERRRAQEALEDSNRQLAKALEDLRAASQVKDEFVAMVSHELRTPLTSMLGWIHLLRSSTTEPHVSARALSSIEANAQAQARLVEDLLSLSQLALGRVRLEVRPLDLTEVVEAALESARPAAAAKSVALEFAREENAISVTADPDRMQQIVWNLLTNAIKFTPRGGRVKVQLRRREDTAQLIVSDNGKGIRPDFLPYVFDRFAQERRARTNGGMGLGLTIVRQLVELHGGTVQAHSDGENRGATFTVSLPLRETNRRKRKPAR